MMSEKQFVVKELEILNEENEWKGEYWWAVVNTQRVEDCFECRNKEVALKLCDFLNKATDDFKWQIRQCEKWSAIVKQLKEENEQLEKGKMESLSLLGEEIDKNEQLRQANRTLGDNLKQEEYENANEYNALLEENEQLRKQVESSETTSNATSHYNAFLESKITTLEKENRELRQELNGKDCRKCGNYCRDKALDYCLVDEREPSYFSFPFKWDYKAGAEKCKYYY